MNPQEAKDLASSGVKDVFDVGSFANFTKHLGDVGLIDDHLPAMMAGMNATGRVLLGMQYNSDVFEDRYGKGDLREMEANLQSAFNSTGECILALKQKSIRAFPGGFGMGELSQTGV